MDWDEYHAAYAALEQAVSEQLAAPRVVSRRRADAAALRYMEVVKPILRSPDLAARYHHAFVELGQAMDRHAQLTRHLASPEAVLADDEADKALLVTLTQERTSAMERFEQVDAEVLAEIRVAKARG